MKPSGENDIIRKKIGNKKNGCKLKKFGCGMQVLNKKANSKRGRV